MSSEEVNEVKNEEVPEVVANEEQPAEQIKEEPKEETEATKPIAKAKATPKKLARTVKVVELVECSACNKKDATKITKKYTPPITVRDNRLKHYQ